MSAMELFRSRVAQSAKAAADAALQLSALDDMAQNDDYVHTEGLKVSEKKQCTELASSVSEISEYSSASVVEDLSGRFVDAFSTAARTKSRPRPVNENNPPVPPHRPDPNWQSTPMAMPTRQKDTPRGGVQPSKSVTHQPKVVPKQPKLVSSVAALYDRNDKQKRAINQPAKRDGSQNRSLGHKKIQPTPAKERGGNLSALKANQSPRSLETIPSSPGHNANVLLVNERHAHILHELDYDSDAESSDDELITEPLMSSSGDLEMGRLSDADQLEQELEESIIRQNSQNGPENDSKDVQRFMKMTTQMETERESLLSVRGSVPDRGEGTKVTWAPEVSRGTAGEETNKALKAGLSWVRNVASPQLEAFSKQIMTKVSEADVKKSHIAKQPPSRGPMIGPRHTPSINDDPQEEKITLTSSTSFLADDDMAELERIRMRNSPSKLRLLIQACIDNPRLGFIAVTLAIAIFAYFYSRHKSVNDVL